MWREASIGYMITSSLCTLATVLDIRPLDFTFKRVTLREDDFGRAVVPRRPSMYCQLRITVVVLSSCV